jgi:hypothetical protein
MTSKPVALLLADQATAYGCLDQCTNEGGDKGSGTSDPRCLIGLGGPDLEIAVVGLQNI